MYRFAPDRLRHFRAVSGLTRKQLAAACGMSESAVIVWETGWRTPRAPTLIALAAALGINPAELFEQGEDVEAIP